uniref:SH2 domain-containing protein n=1 Tax=Panagrellus redivivus TaxID=6233 RepID=A0A7E4ZZ02_PANRE
GSRISGFFKKGSAHQDYPSSEPFESPVDTTRRIVDIDNTHYTKSTESSVRTDTDFVATFNVYPPRNQELRRFEDHHEHHDFTEYGARDITNEGWTHSSVRHETSTIDPTVTRYITSNIHDGNFSDDDVEDENLPKLDDTPDDFKVRITAIEPEQTPQSGTRLPPLTLSATDHQLRQDRNVREVRSYTDRLISPDRVTSPERRRGWTTITETITYARHMTVERTVRGRRQRYHENIEIHEHGLPLYGSSRRYTARSPDIQPRYDSYRSRSQGPVGRMDRWQQTDFDVEDEHRHSPPRRIRDPLRTSPTQYRSRSSERYDLGEHSYRSYSSKFYDRRALLEDQYPSYTTYTAEEVPRRYGTSTAHPTLHYVDPAVSPRTPPSSKRHEYEQAVRHGDLLSSPGSSRLRSPEGSGLRYQTSNLEEIPVSQMLNDFPTVEYDGNAIEPLETRLLEPGVHTRNRPNAPLRRAQHRIRNYCVML